MVTLTLSLTLTLCPTYQGHVYCDGGMTNDFPMNALPEGPGRLGLMVRVGGRVRVRG